MNRFYGFLVSTMLYFSSVVLTSADEVRDFLLKQLNATDFNTISDTFVDGYQSFVISDEQYLFVTKDAYRELMESVKDVERKVNSFQITSRSETADFVTVNFNYNYSFSGGGMFFKFSNYFFNNNYLFYFISFFATLIICSLISKKYLNILLFVLIILNNPQYTIYHKYFDPFILIVFLTIFSFNLDLRKVYHKKNYLFIFAYFLVFLIISNLKLILVV